MKKSFVIVGVIFLGLFIMYIIKDRDDIIDKEYIKEGIKIYYPYFGKEKIDTFINDYLESKEREFWDSNKQSMFMDYDYYDNGEDIELTFYKYIFDNNMVSEIKEKYLVYDEDDNIVKDKQVTVSDYVYDNYYQEVVDKDKPMIAFTFDDGPNYNTSKVIDIFNKYNVKATFFLLGSNIKGHEDIVKKMNSSGMEIGNHTYSHRLLTRLKKEEIKEEFEKTNKLVFEIISKYPSLTRPSYGSTSSTIRSVIETPIIIWDIDTLDWKYHNSKRIYNKVIDKVRDGDIILMHDIYSATSNSLEMIIPKLLDEGYQLVTVSELFYYKNIELKPKNVYGLAR